VERKWFSSGLLFFIIISIFFYKTHLDGRSTLNTFTGSYDYRVASKTLGNGTNRKIIGEYEIKDIPYITERTESSYPQVVAGANQKKLDKWNQIIQEDFDKILQIYSFDPFAELPSSPTEPPKVILRISYEIKLLNNQFLSILYLASYHNPYSAHPTELVYTTNIDTRKDVRLRLKDLIKLDSNFVSYLREWSFITMEPKNPMWNAVIKTILDDMSDEELMTGLETADQIGSGNRWGIYTYLTSENFGVSISVPHFAGDHVELEKAYEELKDYLKPEFDWNLTKN